MGEGSSCKSQILVHFGPLDLILGFHCILASDFDLIVFSVRGLVVNLKFWDTLVH